MSGASGPWQRIEAALGEALQIRAEERSLLLERLAREDPELCREVQSLLDAADASESFLESSAADYAASHFIDPFIPPAVEPGEVVGRYRLLDEIGRGGMGMVWLAERADGQFEQRVALKLIKRGMDTDEVLARFLQERQILARLEHPNIARLLDGGVSGDSRPWFVMEYVAGEAITAHCERRGLGLEARLRLFITTARTVGHAHRNLVVHRDIKPSNVLVTPEGAIKLLDFGVAKMLGDGANSATGVPRMLTPQFASPEQLAGRPVTTASDIYQLGLLLFQLLTGMKARGDRADPDAPVPLPSSVARGATRRLLRGDLDAIVERATRSEPERRYDSAFALAEDVERHLASLPIRAGGDRAGYRLGKFIRRHRLGVASALGGILLSLGFVAFDAVRVRRERDLVRHEADKAVETGQLMARFLQGWNPDASDRGEVSAGKLLREADLRATRELRDRPEMLATTLSILGDFYTTLQEWVSADSLLSRAMAMQEGGGVGSRADLAATIARRARLYRFTGRITEAAAASDRAVAMHRQAFGPRHAETLRVERERGIILRAQKRFAEAEAAARHILDMLGPATDPPTPFALEVASDLGYALFAVARYDEAIEVLRPTLAGQRTLFGDVHASTLFTIRALGSALRDRGDLREAEELYRDALGGARALYGELHSEVEGAILVLSLLLQRTGDSASLAEAEGLARQGLSISQRLYGPDKPSDWGHYSNLGGIYLDQGKLVEAERWLTQALVRSRAVFPKGDPDQADLLNRIAWIRIVRGDPGAASAYREAVAFDAVRPANSPDFVTDGIHFLAMAEQRMGDGALALAVYRRAEKVYRRQLPAGHPYRKAVEAGLRQLQQ